MKIQRNRITIYARWILSCVLIWLVYCEAGIWTALMGFLIIAETEMRYWWRLVSPRKWPKG